MRLISPRHSGARGARTRNLEIPRCASSASEVWSFGPSRNDEQSVLARRFLQNRLQRIALHPRDVVLIFEQRAKGIADHLWRERVGVEFGQRGRPVDGLGDARGLVK